MMLMLHKTIDFWQKEQVDIKAEATEVFITTIYIYSNSFTIMPQ